MNNFRNYLNNLKTPNTPNTPKKEINESTQESLQYIVNSLIFAGNVAQTAHWNLRSKNFISLHEWFGEVYEELFKIADGVAEQIKISNINDIVNIRYNETIVFNNESDIFNSLKDSLVSVKNSIEMAMEDPSISRATQSLIDEWMTKVEKMIWFIEANKEEVQFFEDTLE